MTISLRAAAQASSGASITHSAVAGMVAGDLYLDLLHNTGGGAAPTTDATYPFTAISTGTDGGGRLYTYGYRVATGAETGLTALGPNSATTSIFMGLTGVNATSQIESFQSSSPVSSTTFTVPASTPTADNCWHVVVFACTSSGVATITTPPAGYTLLGTINVSGQGTLTAYYLDLGAGSNGVATTTPSLVWSANVGGLAAGFIVRSATGTAAVPSVNISRLNTSARHNFGLRR